jgi:serine/threonine protein kinase
LQVAEEIRVATENYLDPILKRNGQDNFTFFTYLFNSVTIDGIHIDEYGIKGLTESEDEAGAWSASESPEANQTVQKSNLPGLSMCENLVELEELGRGASGVVHRALALDSFQLVAVKSVRVSSAANQSQIAKEIRALDCMLSAPRGGPATGNNEAAERSHLPPAAAAGPANSADLIQVRSIFYDPESTSVKIVMDYMDGGSALDLMLRGQPLSEAGLAAISIGAIKSLVALHSGFRMHRDIKPANLLLDSSEGAKLCDLGLARKMIASKTGGALDNDATAETFVGTISYMSLERLEGKAYSFPADIHALGLTLLAIALGENPVRGYSFFQLLELLKQPDWSLKHRHALEGRISPAFSDLVLQCIRTNPEERPSAAQLLEHEWVRRWLQPDVPDPKTVLSSIIEEMSEGPRYKRDIVFSLAAKVNAHIVKRCSTSSAASAPPVVQVSLSNVRRLSAQLRVPTRMTIRAFKSTPP